MFECPWDCCWRNKIIIKSLDAPIKQNSVFFLQTFLFLTHFCNFYMTKLIMIIIVNFLFPFCFSWWKWKAIQRLYANYFTLCFFVWVKWLFSAIVWSSRIFRLSMWKQNVVGGNFAWDGTGGNQLRLEILLALRIKEFEMVGLPCPDILLVNDLNTSDKMGFP